MKFSYRVSEQDFREAQRVFNRHTWRRDRSQIVLWTCIVSGLLLLWAFVHQGNAQLEPPGRSFLQDGRSFLWGHGPLVPLLAVAFIVWLVWLLSAGQHEARKNFVKNPNSKGEFAISLAPEGLTITNTTGTTSNAPWSSYEFWIEGTNVIVLVLPSKLQFIISVGMASKELRNELRAILTQVLPKR
jgi:hypothetical protein